MSCDDYGECELAYPRLNWDFLPTNPMTWPMENNISKTDASQNENLATLNWRVHALESQVNELSKSASSTLQAVAGLQAITRTQGKWMLTLFICVAGAVMAAVLRSVVGG